MSIQVGDKIPNASFKQMVDGKIKDYTTQDYFNNQVVVLFALPGAYTPVCSAEHLPGYKALSQEFKQKGVTKIACLSVNDPFVMDAWGKDHDVTDTIDMLADWDGAFTKAMGLSTDLSQHGLGERSKRYAMIVDNGVIKAIDVEADGSCTISHAKNMLSHL